MILTKHCLKNIKTQLDTLGYTNFLYIAPQSDENGNYIAYPFVTYFPVTVNTQYTFSEILEEVKIQFSVFADKAITCMDMSAAIETLFQEYEATDSGLDIYCTHKESENGPMFIGKENYWQHVLVLNFKCQRDK